MRTMILLLVLFMLGCDSRSSNKPIILPKMPDTFIVILNGDRPKSDKASVISGYAFYTLPHDWIDDYGERLLYIIEGDTIIHTAAKYSASTSIAYPNHKIMVFTTDIGKNNTGELIDVWKEPNFEEALKSYIVIDQDKNGVGYH